MLNFLIEVEESEGSTPFNIMPKEWKDADSYVHLASVLPSSSIDLSNGWTRPRHLWGQTPTIAFYTRERVAKLLESKRLRSEIKVFVASKAFSTKLIDSLSTENGPSIVLTNNRKSLHKLRKNRWVRIVETNGKSFNEVIQETHILLVDVLTERQELSFTGETIGKKFYQSFISKKKFLPQIHISPTLLCRANEVVYSQARGRTPRHERFNRLKILETKDCYERNCEISLEIIAEKVLDVSLGTISHGLPLHYGIPAHIESELHEFLKNFGSLHLEDRRNIYISLKERIKSRLGNLRFPKEVTLLLPTVNDLSEDNLLEHLKRTYGTEYEGELRYIVRSVLRGGRGIGLPLFKQGKLTEVAKNLGNTRKEENSFLTAFIGLYASRKLSPVLKTTTVPSSLFFKIRLLREKFRRGLSDSITSQHNNYKTIGEDFEAIRQEMGQFFPSCYHEIIRKIEPNCITIVSDLPFELVSHMNNTALCQNYATTRIPIAPLPCLVNHYNHSTLSPAIELRFKPQDILVTNSIPRKDKTHFEYELFKQTCRQVGLNMNFKTVESSDDFVEMINSLCPDILVYFGHADYDHRSDRGRLKFEKDHLTYEGLSAIKRHPQIVFLVGCETASSAAFAGGLANHLLNLGVKSILATLFPVLADHAATFVGRALAFIEESVYTQSQKLTFAGYVYNARKLGWLNDNLTALEKAGVIDMFRRIKIMKAVSGRLMSKSFEQGGKAPKIHEAIPVFEEVLGKAGILEAWRATKARIIPYSLFFTLIGQGHDLFFS